MNAADTKIVSFLPVGQGPRAFSSTIPEVSMVRKKGPTKKVLFQSGPVGISEISLQKMDSLLVFLNAISN